VVSKKALIDTTILANILLKSGDIRKKSQSALRTFDQSLLPVYAIKEFKAGPLHNYVYCYNKIITTGSFYKTVAAIQRLSLTPQRYKTATALEALTEASKSISQNTTQDILDKYSNTDLGKILYDETRLSLKVKIMMAWKKMRLVATDVVNPLMCYTEVAPTEKRGLIDDSPLSCQPNSKCSVQTTMRDNLKDVKKLWEAIDGLSIKREDINRKKVLKSIFRTPKRDISGDDCRRLGDAVFALIAPNDSVILTTNVKDHRALAGALGKKAVSPDECQLTLAKQIDIRDITKEDEVKNKK
jgi:hypothetical protein